MVDSLLINILTYGIFLLGYVTVVFFIAQLRRDNSVMDIAYGPAFIVSALLTLWWTMERDLLPVLMAGLMGIWAVRLAGRIYQKNNRQPEDTRYAAWRALWRKRGVGYFVLRSYLQINLLQGVIILLVALPFIISLTTTVAEADTLSWLFMLVGLGVYGLGLGIESIADYQLDQFLTRKRVDTEPAILMTTGLFRYCRRPNYFGETLIWWGLAIMVLPLPFGYLALVSPLIITYIVTKVTGPMLEKLFLEKYPDAYRSYMKTTSYFIPWPPSKTPNSLL